MFNSLFMGTPLYVLPSLEVLLGKTRLLAIVTTRDQESGRGRKLQSAPLKSFAEKHEIPLLQPENPRESSFLENLKQWEIDWIVVNAYGFLLPKALLDLPRRACINLHASLLPRHRGASPIHYALLRGDLETGVTAQKMSEKLDEGDILHQLSVPIEEQDDYNSLSQKLSLLSAQCLDELLCMAQGQREEQTLLKPKKQDPKGISYATKIRKEQGKIDWSQNVDAILRQIRAFIHWPCSYMQKNGKTIFIHKAEKYSSNQDHEPGTIIQFDRLALLVQCGDGLLKILVLQPENKRKMDFQDFVNGYSWKIHEKLEKTNHSKL